MRPSQNVVNLGNHSLESMELQFLGFPKDRPSQVVMDYEDYLKIAEQLNLPKGPEPVAQGVSGMEWYSLMESSQSIINSLLGLAFREIWNEAKKENPDNNRISELQILQAEVREVKRNSSLFENMSSMRAIIDKYSPILLSEKKKLASVPILPVTI